MKYTQGFTLIESLVAISILVIAAVAPMSLAAQSLASAFYARDQITAFYLAQEAIESVRAARDGNALSNAFGTTVNLLNGIPSTTGQPFLISTQDNSMALCSTGTCPPLQNNGNVYGYSSVITCGASGSCPITDPWTNTRFTRTVTAEFVGGGQDEVRISVEVSWQTGTFQTRTFTMSENLYRWLEDGAAAE